MAAIKQMAALYALNYHMSCMSREGGIIAGANAVLGEIEGVLYHLDKNDVIYSILKDKIRELKGL